MCVKCVKAGKKNLSESDREEEERKRRDQKNGGLVFAHATGSFQRACDHTHSLPQSRVEGLHHGKSKESCELTNSDQFLLQIGIISLDFRIQESSQGLRSLLQANNNNKKKEDLEEEEEKRR